HGRQRPLRLRARAPARRRRALRRLAGRRRPQAVSRGAGWRPGRGLPQGPEGAGGQSRAPRGGEGGPRGRAPAARGPQAGAGGGGPCAGAGGTRNGRRGLGTPGRTWHDRRRGHRRRAAPAGPRAAPPCPRPDRPRVRAAPRRPRPRSRRPHVRRAPEPGVPSRLRRAALLLPHDPPHRARDDAAAPGRAERHRDLLRRRLLLTGDVQHALPGARRGAARRVPRARLGPARRDPAVRLQARHQTGQESRSPRRCRAPSVNAMDITIHASFLPTTDPEASLAFYRDALGFEVRQDVGRGTMRWITVGPPTQPGTAIVLYPPTADPGITEDEGRVI